MNDEEDQLDGYEYDVGRTKKSSNYNATDAYLQELMSNCIDEWCCNFNIHSPNILNIPGPTFSQSGKKILCRLATVPERTVQY